VNSRHLKQKKKWQDGRRPAVKEVVISIKYIRIDFYCHSWTGVTCIPWILSIVWSRVYIYNISLPGSVQTRQRTLILLATQTLTIAGWSSAYREQNLSATLCTSFLPSF
jgi:hypothetical protein